jgi:GH15 family glucan-1,4-alpha-glucosidase
MRRIEDYALIGDCETAALVGRDGSIDWLCWPAFDSDPCFAALLGGPENGRWKIAPPEPWRRVERGYLPGTLVLETRFQTEGGVLAVIDFMPLRDESSHLVRIVRCEAGRVRATSELTLRFDYGRLRPWLTIEERSVLAIAGPHGVRLISDVGLCGDRTACLAELELAAGEQATFVLSHYASHQLPPAEIDAAGALSATTEHWRAWVRDCRFEGPWREAVARSLITLKAVTFRPTGGLVAAPTSSLPAGSGGRNWDYRFCWLRDATFTLMSLLYAGYTEEAAAWRDWLLRAVAGSADDIQPIYTLMGDRRLAEWEAPWLAGFNGAQPVRFGNAAAEQVQLDVFGEVVDALYQAGRAGVTWTEAERRLVAELVGDVERRWREPDRGIWEVRGPPQRFTHSQVLAWVAVDRAIREAEASGLGEDLDRWRRLRGRMHAEICRECYDADQGCFTQAAGSRLLDASTLLIPQVGFLPPDDARVAGTIEAIRRGLMRDGFVHRYNTYETDDGLAGGEASFLACTFWLADALALQGRRQEAEEIFERLLSIRNDVGLLAEQYDPTTRLMAGNFPQALSHLSLVNTAFNLLGRGPAHERSEGGAPATGG